jgi:hypothetical protein
MPNKKPKSPTKPEPETYERSDFFRDLGKASRQLGPEESEKKKPKGRRSSGRSPKKA